MGQKRCSRCRKVKPLTEFHAHAARGDGHQGVCKGCKHDIYKVAYHADDAGMREGIQARNKRVAKAIREFIQESKRGKRCMRCGHDDWRVLQYHHRDRATKDFSLGAASGRKLCLARVAAEIAKCDLLCANCHILVTHYDVAPGDGTTYV